MKTPRVGTAFYPEVPPISLELTSRCNQTCPYCANSALTRQKKNPFIEWALLQKVVDQCADGKHNIAALHGTGEPLLWHRLEDAIALIKSRNAGDATFATNGTLLTERRIASLLEAGMTSIRVSLDTLDEEVYAATRGGKLSKTIANVQGLVRATPEAFSLTIVLMNHKDHEIRERDMTTFHELFGVSAKVRMEIVENGLMVGSPEDFRRSKVTVASCWRSMDWFTITYEGKVSICCSDQNALQVLGDVNVQTIEEIWFDPENQATFRNVAAGVAPCPAVCTERCYLRIPERADRPDEAFSSSIDELTASAERLLVSGRFSEASERVEILRRRAPHDPQAGRLHEILGDIVARNEENAYRAAAEERLALIGELDRECRARLQIIEEQGQALTQKEEEVRRSRRFVEALRRELEERRIEVTTPWPDQPRTRRPG